MSFFQLTGIIKVFYGNQGGRYFVSRSFQGFSRGLLFLFRNNAFFKILSPEPLYFFDALDNIPGFINILPLNVPPKMFLDNHGGIVLKSSLFRGLFTSVNKLWLWWVEGVWDEEVFLFLNARTQERDLLLEFVVYLWVKDGFLDDLADLVLGQFHLLFCWFTLVRLWLCVRMGWGRRWLL